MFPRRYLRTCLLVLMHVLLHVEFSQARDTEVKIEQGKLSGKYYGTVSKLTKYYSYKGIPYAEPPVGERRFQPPQPHKGWKDTLLAVKHGENCPNADRNDDDTPKGSEDCLYLNVYTPALKRGVGDSPLPVMFWIHGGFFRDGSGNADFYGPDYFMDEDVVLVTINYRLGVLGFLDLEDEIVSGNMGLKDIILALKWVNKNIGEFGGDSKRVAIFGNGSGGVAVDILILSSAAKGLFSRAIMQSGVGLESSYFHWSPRKRAFDLAKEFEIDTKDSKSLLKAFKNINGAYLVGNASRTIDIYETRRKQYGVLPFSPSVTKLKDDAILTELPEDIFKNNNVANKDVPIMIGFNSQESILDSKYFIQRPHLLKMFEKEFHFLMPIRGLYSELDSDYYYELMYRIKHFYFTNGTINTVNGTGLTEYLNFISDNQVFPIDKTVREYVNSNTAPVYYYRFSYEGGLSYFRNQATIQLFDDFPINIDGAARKDELCYLFKCNVMSKEYTKLYEDDEAAEDLGMVEKMIRLWTNFARTGNPTPDKDDDILNGVIWPPVTKKQKNFLDLNQILAAAVNPHFKSVDFWDSMYEHYLPLATDGVLRDIPKDTKDEL